LFSLSTDFKFEGEFDAYWKKLFAFAKEKRPKEFGERPNKACFDVDADFKIWNQSDPTFTPFELNKKGYDDCMLLMAHYTCVDWCLRGAKEVRLIVVSFPSLVSNGISQLSTSHLKSLVSILIYT